MNKYAIPIIGLIASKEDSEPDMPSFGMTDLLFHLSKAKDFDAIELQFDSPGGFCDMADKMIDLLSKIDKPLFSTNIGQVCSAASKMFTVAPKENRTYNPDKGVFLIHNPWGTIEGDASELAQASKELLATENDYAKWYASKTGSDLEIIKGFMAENTPLTPEQVEGLGFAKIVKSSITPIAFLNSKHNLNMDKKEFEQKLSVFEKFLAKFKFKAFILNDVNGTELEFPDLTDISELKPGVKVTAPDGEYTMPDGSVLVVAANVVKEIKPAAGGGGGDEELAKLKAEIEALKAENEKLKGEKATALENAEKTVNEVKAEFKKFRAQFTDVNFKNDTPPEGDKNAKKIGKPEFLNLLNLQ